jgi:hypothetical protein
VLWIFIALKYPYPWPGLNPRPLGPVASTLTTTPPRRLRLNLLQRLHRTHIPYFVKAGKPNSTDTTLYILEAFLPARPHVETLDLVGSGGGGLFGHLVV